MRNNITRRILLMATLLLFLLPLTVVAADESCVRCHLHSELADDFAASSHETNTLAGFHGAVFRGRDTDSGCEACHRSQQNRGKFPSKKICLGCHTRGKTGQGDQNAVFHAEEKHWPMDEISCTTCHKGHTPGNRLIKFLSIDAIDTCQQCHKKSFRSVAASPKPDPLMPEEKSDNYYGQN